MFYQNLKTSLAGIVLLLVTFECLVRADFSPFQSLSFEDACQKAKQENKIVFIDFFTTWCGPCKMLDAITWKDPRVVSLLQSKTIPLRLDAEKNVELAKRYSVQSYPTLALIKPDGSLIDSLSGYQDANTFTDNFNASLKGITSLARAQKAVQNSKPGDITSQVEARYNLGQELARKGENADALAQYLWCYDDGMKQAAGYRGVRNSFLLSNIKQLAGHYPPAQAALLERQQASLRNLAGGDIVSVADFGSLNHCLGQDRVTLAYFEKLPSNSPQRPVLGFFIFESLVTGRNYDEAISAQPYTSFKTRFLLLSQSVAKMPAALRLSMVTNVVELAAEELEALAGAGKIDDAHNLIKMVLAFDKSDATVATLRNHAIRAGHPELM